MANEKTMKILPLTHRALRGFLNALTTYADTIAYVRQTAPFKCGLPRYVYEEDERLFEKRRRMQVLRYLRKKKLIEYRIQRNRFLWRFTNDGLVAALKDKITDTTKRLRIGHCIILFDIPEATRDIRDELRNFLKSAGFIYLQRSAWVTDKNVKDDLTLLCSLLGISPWTTVRNMESSNAKTKMIASRFSRS